MSHIPTSNRLLDKLDPSTFCAFLVRIRAFLYEDTLYPARRPAPAAPIQTEPTKTLFLLAQCPISSYHVGDANGRSGGGGGGGTSNRPKPRRLRSGISGGPKRETCPQRRFTESWIALTSETKVKEDTTYSSTDAMYSSTHSVEGMTVVDDEKGVVVAAARGLRNSRRYKVEKCRDAAFVLGGN